MSPPAPRAFALEAQLASRPLDRGLALRVPSVEKKVEQIGV